MMQICLNKWFHWHCFPYLSWFFFCHCTKILAAGWFLKKGFLSSLGPGGWEVQRHTQQRCTSFLGKIQAALAHDRKPKCKPVLERGEQGSSPWQPIHSHKNRMSWELHSRTPMPPESPSPSTGTKLLAWVSVETIQTRCYLTRIPSGECHQKVVYFIFIRASCWTYPCVSDLRSSFLYTVNGHLDPRKAVPFFCISLPAQPSLPLTESMMGDVGKEMRPLSGSTPPY